MTTLFMFADVDVHLLPEGAYAYAGDPVHPRGAR